MAARRAQKRLEQTLDYIDWVEDVLGPESEAILSGNFRPQFELNPATESTSVIKVTVDAPEVQE
jgi:hypothetical protein